MTTTRSLFWVTAFALGAGLALSLSVPSFADDKPASHSGPMSGHSEGSMDLHRIMDKREPMSMSGDVDRDFATMMSMHHAKAIEMSDVLLRYGKNAELKALAQKMKEQQAKEIEQMAPYKK